MALNIDNLDNNKYWYEHDDEYETMPWRIYESKSKNEKNEDVSEEIAKTYEESDAIKITEALNSTPMGSANIQYIKNKTMNNFHDIKGVIETPNNVSTDQLTNEFIEFIESKGYTFGGGFASIDENGEPIKENRDGEKVDL